MELPISVTLSGNMFTLRKLTIDDMPQFLCLYRKLRWTNSDSDLMAAQQYYPDAFLGAFTESGQLISSCVCAECNEDTFIISYYLTKEEYRGKGIGSFLLKLTADERALQNIYLISLPERVSYYEKAGFMTTGECFYYLHTPFAHYTKFPRVSGDFEVMKMTEDDMDDVLRYEKTVCKSINKSRLTIASLSKSHGIRLIARVNSSIVGMVSFSPYYYDDGSLFCDQFYADGIECAAALLHIAVRNCDGSSVSAFILHTTTRNAQRIEILFNMFGIGYKTLVSKMRPGKMCFKGPSKSQLVIDHEKVFSLSNALIQLF